MIVHLNGDYLDERDARLSIEDRGFLAADGVFETALLHRGGFFRLRPHLERFAASAATFHLPAPATEELIAIVRALARANALQDASIRITLTRGVATPTLLVTLRPVDRRWIERARAGWHVITAATRRPSTAAAPAQLKALGRTHALLARHEAAAAGVDDALLLTDDGSVCEGPAWNVFWREGRTLFTPALELGVLAGITRGILLELARDAGFVAIEGVWNRAVLDDAEEIFATMTSVGVVAFRSLDGRALPPLTPALAALQSHYWQLVRQEAAADPA